MANAKDRAGFLIEDAKKGYARVPSAKPF
jgi:hypothetical protein